MLTLLLAAINKRNKGLCKGLTISIKGGEKNRFIEDKDVEQLMLKTAGGDIKGQSVESIDLNRLEQVLEKNVWISSAELWFDSQDQLHVSVVEKEPVARVFTNEGASFYIDSAGARLPLSDQLSARVPVFTGFPDKKVLGEKDSMLLNDIRRTAAFILHDDFWMAQVSQIDITPKRNLEMIPVVGSHIVKLGKGDEIEKKFRRLMIFYQQVMSKTGFNKYKMIDVQYEGQVVASVFDASAGIDSVQLRKNVEKLLKGNSGDDGAAAEVPIVPGRYNIEADSAELREGLLPGNENPDSGARPDNPAADNVNRPKPARQPRAVMPRRVNN